MSLQIEIKDEVQRLEAVVIGRANSIGTPLPIEQSNDPKSRFHKINNSYPVEEDLVKENEALREALESKGVQVIQPENLQDENQVFARDIGFVVDNIFIKGNMGTAARQVEYEALRPFVEQQSWKVAIPPETVKIEGGDIFPYYDKIFVGQAAKGCEDLVCNRTNPEALNFLAELFPGKTIVPIPLYKSDEDPFENCLHLDCAFQPVGNNDHSLIFEGGFENIDDAKMLVELFGGEANSFKMNRDQMFHMNSNVFSIATDTVISGENNQEFGAVNDFLKSSGIEVISIPYSETSKMGGLLRCSTLPMKRRYE